MASTTEILANTHAIKQLVELLDKTIKQIKYFLTIVLSIAKQSTVITESSFAIEQMTESTNRISKGIDKRVFAVRELQTTIESGHHEMEETIAIVKKSAQHLHELLTGFKAQNKKQKLHSTSTIVTKQCKLLTIYHYKTRKMRARSAVINK